MGAVGPLAGQSEPVLPVADPATTPAGIARSIESVTEESPVDQLHWGVLVVDLESGDTLYARNAHRKFIPASNMKVLTTAAALWELGPGHRFRTEVHAVGERNGDALRGDLVLLPSGDPSWSDRWHADDPEAPLRSLADQVAATGIRTVSGDLIVAASRWDSVSTPSSWMRGNIPWGFSAVPTPIAVAEATTTVEVRGTLPGALAEIEWSPRVIPDFVESRVRTVAAEDTTAVVDAFWLPESGLHRLEGTVRAGRADTLELSTRIPAAEARLRLIELLGESGVDVLQLPAPEIRTPGASSRSGRGEVGEGAPENDGASERDDPLVPSSSEGASDLVPLRPRVPIVWAEADSLPTTCDPSTVAWCDVNAPVAVVESPPLLEIARGALEPSQNWITEQLLRALAIERFGVASWANGPDALVEVLAERAAVDTLDLSIRDGSGLSAYNLITPRAVVSILTEMDRGELAAGYRDALAAPREEDSTLEYRLDGLEERVQAKTGTLSNVNSLSGYLETDSGRRLAFSILTNGSGLPSSRVRRAIDRVVRVLSEL